jgi:hypothetical protein
VLQPVTHSWTRSIPTGLGFNPHAYRRSQSIRPTPNPLIAPRTGQGLGITSIQIAQQGTGIATAGVSAGLAIASGTALGLATGIGGAIIAAYAIYQLISQAFAGCGQTCTAATSIANQVATLLGNNLTSYLSQPVHYYSVQQAALNTFNQAWALLVQNCSNTALGVAGQNCISQRQQGACAYQTSPGGWQQDSSGNWTYIGPGANGSGTTCWNWFIGYHDPIANDPTVQPDPVGLQVQVNGDGSVTVTLPEATATVDSSGNVVSSSTTPGEQTAAPVTGTSGAAQPTATTTTTTTASTSSLMPLLLIGGGALLLLMVMD